MKLPKINLKLILKKLFQVYELPPAEKPLKLNENLSGIRPHIRLPESLPKRQFLDKTPIYTYQPPRPYLSTLRPLNEFLIQESLQEKLRKLEDNQKLLTFAKLNLPLQGVLKAKGGSYYLDISPQFSRSFPYGKTPSYQQKITIIHAEEQLDTRVKEEGMMFSFTLKGYYQTEPVGWTRMKTAYILLIECPALEEMRSKYHLSPTPYGRGFHLLLSMDPTFDAREETNYYHVSVSNYSI